MAQEQRLDIGEARARQAALDHLVRASPAWRGGVVQRVRREGRHYIVTLMPENKQGILAFFMTYTFWVDAATGAVNKMR